MTRRCPSCNQTIVPRLARELANERRAIGLTQEALALKIGCHRAAITRIEAGMSGMSASLLYDYARAVGVELTTQRIAELLRCEDA